MTVKPGVFNTNPKLGPDGQQLPPNGDVEAIGYEIFDHPIGAKKNVRVITIGGGASGINLAYQIQKHMQNVEHVVYERNPELGGTWYENRYPGCACDVPSHAYQFSYHPNPKWSHFYSGSAEICAYMNSVADDYQLRDQFKVSHEVVGAHWDDAAREWVVRVQPPNGDEFEDRADFLVNGCGILNKWQWPKLPGLEKFKGKMMHTAAWDESYDFKGKKIAVIGVGSSAVQAVPQLVPLVEHMTCFIRSGAWITAGGIGEKFTGPGAPNKPYSDEQKKLFSEDPAAFLAYRKSIEEEINVRYKMYMKDTDQQAAARKMATESMARKLAKKPELIDLLTPNFAVGCRRITPGNGFLESLCEDNVRVVSNPIVSISEKGVITQDGEEHEVDALVCATGFDVSFLPRFPMIGARGANLQETWTTGPTEAYMSLMVPNYPNYFWFFGPAGPVAHGSITQTLEWMSHWMLKCISKMQAERIRSISPKATVTRQFNIHRNALMPVTSWSTDCASWYKVGKKDGPVVAIHPGSKLHFFDMTRSPRFEDMDIDYDAENMFAYLGNGYAKIETESGHDMSYFITDPHTVSLPW